jgi:phage baseplate assembly protein V
MRQLIDPIARRIRMMVSRAVIRLVNDATRTQNLQIEILKGEVYSAIERLQEYGFSSVPHAGAEAIVLSLNGDRGHGVVIVAADKRYRLTGLESGEVALHDDQGQMVAIKRDGIEIISSMAVNVTSPTLTHNGVNIGATHTHISATPGNPTSVPS